MDETQTERESKRNAFVTRTTFLLYYSILKLQEWNETLNSSFILAVFNEIFILGIDFEGVGINLLGIPIGGLSCYFLYHFLEKKWKREYVNPLAEIDSIGVTNE